MAKNKICDVCNIRSAEFTVTVVRNSIQETLNLCDIDYYKLRQTRVSGTRLDSLFSKDPFLTVWKREYDDEYDPDNDFRNFSLQSRDYFEIDKHFTDHTKDLMERSGEIALSFNRDEVETEHILYALTESPVIEEIFANIKIELENIRKYIDLHSTRGDIVEPQKGQVTIIVSPRVKNALDNAFATSANFAHNYVGPEHLLIGLIEEPDGMAGNLLREHGLSSEKAEELILEVIGRGERSADMDEKD